MRSGASDLMGIPAAGAQITQAKSAPLLKALIPAKYGAPVYSFEPPIITTFPQFPLRAALVVADNGGGSDAARARISFTVGVRVVG